MEDEYGTKYHGELFPLFSLVLQHEPTQKIQPLLTFETNPRQAKTPQYPRLANLRLPERLPLLTPQHPDPTPRTSVLGLDQSTHFFKNTIISPLAKIFL